MNSNNYSHNCCNTVPVGAVDDLAEYAANIAVDIADIAADAVAQAGADAGREAVPSSACAGCKHSTVAPVAAAVGNDRTEYNDHALDAGSCGRDSRPASVPAAADDVAVLAEPAVVDESPQHAADSANRSDAASAFADVAVRAEPAADVGLLRHVADSADLSGAASAVAADVAVLAEPAADVGLLHCVADFASPADAVLQRLAAVEHVAAPPVAVDEAESAFAVRPVAQPVVAAAAEPAVVAAHGVERSFVAAFDSAPAEVAVSLPRPASLSALRREFGCVDQERHRQVQK